MRPALSVTGLIVGGVSCGCYFRTVCRDQVQGNTNYGQVVETMLTESTFSFGAFAFGCPAAGAELELVAELLIEADSRVPVISTSLRITLLVLSVTSFMKI